MRIRSFLAGTLSAALAAASGACGGSPGGPSRPNLLLVTFDTTRADRLGCYGKGDAGTVTLDRLAREGAAADDAIAVAPLTLPSHASIFTGLYPPRHGVRDNGDFRLPDAETTLAEHLRAQGYATAASVGAHVLSSKVGMAQGFESFFEPSGPTGPEGGAGVAFVPMLERRADAVTADALTALRRIAGRPFFLWVHYFDPHADYAPPEPQLSQHAGDRYQGEIAYADAQLGRIVAELETRGLLDATLVVATADHGESLGEHEERTHGLFVYDATLRVPLLARLPGAVVAGRRHAALVSGVDLAPTILDLMGLPPLPAAQGVSHASPLRGDGPAPERAPAYAESLYGARVYGWAPLVALRSGVEKFIEAPEPEIYDLRADPGELRNLAPERADAVRDWQRRARAARESLGHPVADAAAPLSDEERAALESLGYLSAPRDARPRGVAPDPKRMVAVHEKYLEAKTLVASRDPARVLALVDEILEVDPGNPGALSLRGMIAFAGGDRTRGLDALIRAAADAPGVFENQWNLATALHEERRFGEAIAAYRAAAALQPGTREAWQGLGAALLAARDPRGAIEALQRGRALGDPPPALLATLGAAQEAAGDPAAAEKTLQEAVAADPGLAPAWNKLGVLAEKGGRRAEARERYDRALAASPSLADALFNRAKLALLEKRIDDAARDAATLTEAHPDYAAGWFLRGQAAAARGDRPEARAALQRFVAMPGADPRLAGAARDLLRRMGT